MHGTPNRDVRPQDCCRSPSGPPMLGLLTAHQLNAVSVTAKVRRIERQQPAFPVGQHGCDDVGVVDLPPTNGNFSTQRDQPVGDDRQIFAYDLPADPQRFKALNGSFQTCPGHVVVRGFKNPGIYEDVGVYEHPAGYSLSS